MATERERLEEELARKDLTNQQFNLKNRLFNFDVEYIRETSPEDNSNNLVIQSEFNNIQLVVKEDKNIELFGNVIVKENINFTSAVFEDARINSDLFTGGKSTFNDDVSLNKNVYMKENLEVQGDISINNILVNGKIDISENLYVNGDVSFQQNLDVNSNIKTTNLTVSNNTTLKNDLIIKGEFTSDKGIIHADTTISSVGSNILYQETSNGSKSILSRLQGLGDASFNKNVNIEGGLIVGGPLNNEVLFNNDVSFVRSVQIGDLNNVLSDDSQFIVNLDSGFGKDLEISGNLKSNVTVINETLTVEKDVTFKSSLEVVNNLLINGDVSLNGKVDISDNISLKNKLQVDGDVSLNSNVDISGTFKINDLIVNGNVFHNANVDISNKLVVYGDISLNSSVDISNNLKVGNKLIVESDTSMNSSLDISNNLNVNNKLTIGGDVLLKKNVDILENLNVNYDISVNSNLKIGNKLIVGDDASFNSSLDISNNLNVNNKLYVKDDVSLNKNVDISENVNIGGNTIILGNLQAKDVSFANFTSTNIIVNDNGIEIGKDINSLNSFKIGIGSNAGKILQGNDAISLGNAAGHDSQGIKSIAIGRDAGNSNQQEKSIAIGTDAGNSNQQEKSIAIGTDAGNSNQGITSIAIGNNAGNTNQGSSAIAIGEGSGEKTQGITSIAIGKQAGFENQKEYSVAIGNLAGRDNQFKGSVAIGNEAGCVRQGNYSIAIGNKAGRTSQASNSIVLNAIDSTLNSYNSGLYINPIRNSVNLKKNVMQYDTVTKELIYAYDIDISGAITAGVISCRSLTTGLIDILNNDLSMGSGNIVTKTVTSDEINIKGDASMNLNVNIGEKLNVYGNTKLFNRLDVTNDVSFQSSVNIDKKLLVNGDSSFNANVDISGDFTVWNDVNIENKLLVKNTTTFLGDVDVIGQLGTVDFKLTGDVSFQENVDIEKYLRVNNDASLNGNVTVATNIRVGGNGDIINDLSIGNNVTIGGELDISGSANLTSLNVLADLSVNDNLLLGKELKVDGNVSLYSSVSISNGLIVNGDVSMNGNVYINDGNINVGTNNTLDISLGTLILRDNQISGDKINGGTIDEISISKLMGPMDCNNQILDNVNINNGALNNLSIVKCDIILTSNNVIDISAATFILKENQIGGDAINGGTIQDISISKLGGSMDCNDQEMSNVNISGGIINTITISNDLFFLDNTSMISLNNNMIIDFSLSTLLLRDKQISGDKINGGTIHDISISKLGGSIDCSDQLMSNVNISGGIMNHITISNSDLFMFGKTIDLSGATIILKDDEISGDKIKGGIIHDITISELHGPIDFCNQMMSNVNISGGIINGVTGNPGNTKYGQDVELDLSAALVIFSDNQINGDYINQGTIDEITISKLTGGMNCNTQAMTNVNILSGNLTGVTINGAITISTLEGPMNANNQFISNVNIDEGNISNVSISATSYSGSGIIDNIGSEPITSSKLATAGAIKSYILYGNGGGVNNDISFGNMDLSGTLNARNINLSGNIIPTEDAVFSIGTPDRQIKDLYLSSSTLFMGTSIAGEVTPVLRVKNGKAEFIGEVRTPLDISTNTKLDTLEVVGNTSLTNPDSNLLVECDANFNKNLDVSGTIFAEKYIGDGSLLTGLSNVVLDNYSDASFGYLDISNNLSIRGDIHGTTASLSNIIMYGDGVILGPPEIIIDPIVTGSPDASGTVIIRGSLQVMGETTTVTKQTLTISNNIITVASNPAIGSAGFIVKDVNDISRGIVWLNNPYNTWDISDNLHMSSNLTLEGDVSVNSDLHVLGTINGTLGSEAQPNITSTGTLTSLTMGGDIDLAGNNLLNGGNISGTLSIGEQPYITTVGTLQGANFSDNINLGGYNLLNGGTLSGTLTTPIQENIITLGVLTGLSMEGDLDLAGQNITNAGNISGTLTYGAQPNITSIGELSELKLSGGLNLSNHDISNIRYLYTTTVNTTNVVASNTVNANYLAGIITRGEQPYISVLENLTDVTVDNLVVTHITFSGENIVIDGGDVSINQTLDCSALIVNKLTVSGDTVEIKSNDISMIGLLHMHGSIDVDGSIEIQGDISATRFIGDGRLLTGITEGLLNVYYDSSFTYVDICKNLIVQEDVSVNRNLDVSGNISATTYIGNGSQLTNLFPSITGNAGKVLITDGYIRSWTSDLSLNNLDVNNDISAHNFKSSRIHVEDNMEGDRIKIGSNAGQFNAGEYMIAIGNNSAMSDSLNNNYNVNSIAIGRLAAQGGTGENSIALGYNSGGGTSIQGNNSVCIGSSAITSESYGIVIATNGVCEIGEKSIVMNTANNNFGLLNINNSIILNANTMENIPSENGAFYVSPIRNIQNNAVLQYNKETNEVTESLELNISSIITQDLSVNNTLEVDGNIKAIDISVTNLDVSGSLHISSGTTGDCTLIIEADTDNNNESYTPGIEFRLDGGIERSFIGHNNSNALDIKNSSETGDIRFFTDSTDGHTNAIERMVIRNDGKIGIGVTAPTRTLDLGSTGQVTFGDNHNIDGNQGIYWHEIESGQEKYGIYRTSGAWDSSDYQQLMIRFNTGIILNPGAGEYDKSYVGVLGGMSIGNNYYTTKQNNGIIVEGKVGIGTRDPSSALHVVGDVSLNANVDITDSLTVKGDLSVNTFSAKYVKLTSTNIGIGNNSGTTAQGNKGIALGFNAGNDTQSNQSIAIGDCAGQIIQGSYGIAIGTYAGNNKQGTKSVAIGYHAGRDQSGNNVAIGNQAGETQGDASIAIGDVAGKISQGTKAIAIGHRAGYENQGENSIAIGNGAGSSNQHNNTIVLNATVEEINTVGVSGLYIDPVREAVQVKALYYNTTTKEITYDNSGISGHEDNLSFASVDISGTFKIQNRSVKPILDNYITSRNLTVIGGNNTGENVDKLFTLAYSMDGLDYIGVKDSSNIMHDVRGVVYDSKKNMWFAVGEGIDFSIIYSYDGIEWYGIENSKENNFTTRGLVIKIQNDRIIAGGEGNNIIGYSDDGLNWTYVAIDSGTSLVSDITYHHSTDRWYIICRDDESEYQNLKYSTTNGSTWQGINIESTDYNFTDGTCIGTNGSRIIVGYKNIQYNSNNLSDFNSMIYSDDNGLTWSACLSNTNESIGPHIFSLYPNKIIYANGIWISGGTQYSENKLGYSIAYSDDGIIWTGVSGSTDLLTSTHDIEWNGIRWVATGTGEYSIIYSDDNGINWYGIIDSSKNIISIGHGLGVTDIKNTFATNETIKRLKLNDVSDVLMGSRNFENSLKIGSNKTGILSLAERNTIIGISGGDLLTSGSDNTSVGYNTINSITYGKDNVAIGSSALESLTSGSCNNALGKDALKHLTIASNNTAIGDKALTDCIGLQNTALGYRAGSSITDGSYNIAIGSMSGHGITSGTGNIYIGYQSTDNSVTDSSNAIAIGNMTSSSSNKITIGNTSHTHSKIYGDLTIPGDASFNGGVDILNELNVTGIITTSTSVNAASLIIGSADINETDLEKIDNISNGLVSSSKAVVVDDNKDIGGFNLLSAITLSGENINIKGKDLYNILDFFLELDSFTS